MRRVRARLLRMYLVLEAMAWLTIVWLTSHVLPGKLYRRLLPRALASSSQTASVDSPLAVPCDDLVRRIGSAVVRASDAVPFRSVCFHRGIAAYRMLQRRGIPSTLHYGVAKGPDDRGLQAHVWVSSKGQDVVGGRANAPFQEIALFSSNTDCSFLPDAEC